MRDGIRACGALLFAHPRNFPFYQNSPVCAGEGKINMGSTLKTYLLPLRAFRKPGVESLKREDRLDLHSRKRDGGGANSHDRNCTREQKLLKQLKGSFVAIDNECINIVKTCCYGVFGDGIE